MNDPVLSPLAQAEQRLQAYLIAERRILDSQEYMIGNGGTARRNRRADLEQVQNGIREVRAEIAQLQTTAQRGRRISYLRPY